MRASYTLIQEDTDISTDLEQGLKKQVEEQKNLKGLEVLNLHLSLGLQIYLPEHQDLSDHLEEHCPDLNFLKMRSVIDHEY